MPATHTCSGFFQHFGTHCLHGIHFKNFPIQYAWFIAHKHSDCTSHHKANLLPGGQPLQELTAQLVAQDAGLAQAALQGLLIFLAGVRAPPRGLKNVVDDTHDILPQAAV